MPPRTRTTTPKKNTAADAGERELEAQKLEASGATTVTVDFRGEKFVIDVDFVNSLDFLEAVEDEKSVATAKAILGSEDAYRRFKNSVGPDGKRADRFTVLQLMDAIAQAVNGMTLPESEASQLS